MPGLFNPSPYLGNIENKSTSSSSSSVQFVTTSNASEFIDKLNATAADIHAAAYNVTYMKQFVKNLERHKNINK